MNSALDREHQDMTELLAGKALGQLSADEEALVADALTDEANQFSLSELELTAAAVELAFNADGDDDLPPSLKDRIRQQWQAHEFSDPVTSTKSDRAAIPRIEEASAREPQTTKQSSPTISAREVLAWLACAASLLIAGGLWFSRPVVRPVQVAAIGLAQSRADLQSESGTIVSAWTNGPTPIEGDVRGDVVWNTEKQQGFMRFVGMRVNNPSVEQYQLWIIDPERDDEPIDGGVFDISSTDEVIIPIDAKLRVVEPSAFAITIEKPGGVVVSTQEKLPLLAPVG